MSYFPGLVASILMLPCPNPAPITEYNVDEFYKKVDLESGTLDDNGNDIEFIFVVTSLPQGRYEVKISSQEGDLYEINGTELFIKFRNYYGYGYNTEGLLIVGSSAYSSKFIKYDD
jgi:hypothetical protein